MASPLKVASEILQVPESTLIGADAPSLNSTVGLSLYNTAYSARVPYLISIYNNASKASVKDNPVAQTCVQVALNLTKEFLLKDQSSSKSELANHIDLAGQTNFLLDLPGVCSPEETRSIFFPVLSSLVGQVQKACDSETLLDTNAHFQALSRLNKALAHPSVVFILANLLMDESATASSGSARDLQNRSILAPFFDVSPTMPFSSKYYSRIAKYPCCIPADFESVQSKIQMLIGQYEEQLHQLSKKLLTCKENTQVTKDALLDWFGTMMEMNSARAHLNQRDPMFREMLSFLATEGFLINVYKVLLLLSQPFLDISSGRHKMIHPRYCQFAKRVDYTQTSKITTSNAFTLDGVDDKMQKGMFPFISDVFFMALHALHTFVAPIMKTYRETNNRLIQTRNLINQQRAFGDQWLNSPEGQRHQNVLNTLYLLVDGYDAHLNNPQTAEMTVKFVSLTMYWLLDVYKQNKDNRALLEQLFASYPDYLIKTPPDILTFYSLYKPKFLLHLNLPLAVEFAQTFLNEPSLVRSPLVRSKLVNMLAEFHIHTKTPNTPNGSPSASLTFGFSFNQPATPNSLDAGDRLMFSRLFSGPSESLKPLLSGLFQIYKDVDVVEGLDVDKEDFDKYGVRRHVCVMLTEFWQNNSHKQAIIEQLTKNPEQQTKFLGTVLNDAIMLLDDSLGRLIDIRQIQVAMDNTAEWNAQPQHVLNERIAYYEMQERSSRGFLSLAITTLDLLGNLAKEVFQQFVATPEIRLRLVAMLLHFFEILCGPKMINLKVKNPEKYLFNPKELLRKIVTLTLVFAHSAEFKEAMAADFSYNQAVMQKAHHIIVREQIVPAQACDQFLAFIQNIEKAKGADEPSESVTPAADGAAMEIDEELQKELEEAFEKEYIYRMEGLVFGEAEIAEGTGYRHHFQTNIKESAGMFNKERMQRLASECQILNDDLPTSLSRTSGIFVRIDSDRPDVMKAMIVGPQDTPYAGGCFVFDIYFPNTYPNDPPLVNLATTGNGTVRFNPNLYNCGKVCLSLLGTWHGDANSKWNPVSSNLKQVLLSIQALILVEEPYYNEPSYEMQRGTAEGTSRSHEYNQIIRFNTVRYAMVEQLRSPPVEFADVVKQHFQLQRDILLRQCQRWASESTTDTEKAKFARLHDELAKQFAKL